MDGPTDMKRKGTASIEGWINYATFDLSNASDLGLLSSNLKMLYFGSVPDWCEAKIKLYAWMSGRLCDHFDHTQGIF